MKFVKVLEHNGELYKVGDTICATFNTGISASGVIKDDESENKFYSIL